MRKVPAGSFPSERAEQLRQYAAIRANQVQQKFLDIDPESEEERLELAEAQLLALLSIHASLEAIQLEIRAYRDNNPPDVGW